MWRQSIKTTKNGADLDKGQKVSAMKVAYTPTTALGWRDHFQDQQKATTGADIANVLSQHLTDNPDHQAQLAGAISSALGGGN